MKRIILYFTFLISHSSYAVSFNIGDRIMARNFHLDSYPIFFGEKVFSDKNVFKKRLSSLSKKKQKRVLHFIQELDDIFPEKILLPLAYWRTMDPSLKNVARILTYTLVDKILIMRDYADDPSYTARIEILQKLRELTRIPNIETDKIMKTLLPIFLEKGQLLSEIREDNILIQAIKETKLLTIDLKKILNRSQVYCLDHYGIINGNEIELLSDNDTSKSKIQFFNHNAITNGGVLDFKSELIQVPNNGKGHPSLNEPIFKKVISMIDDAQESIFMDLYIIGGTLGATIAEHLVETVKSKLISNPKFKVFILHDFNHNIKISDEINPIFTYIEKRRVDDKKLYDAIILLQSNTQRHPEGIPLATSNLKTRRIDVVEKESGVTPNSSTKIDHSKVIVIDGNTDSPKAWVGSKNLSDNNGGYSFDNAVYIHGPAAALIQDSYYKDVMAALTTDPIELKEFKSKIVDNRSYHSRKSEILRAFKITNKKVSYKGSDSVRLTEVDVNGTIRNTRNLIIDMIQKANDHIYMEQHFIYDPYIIDALIKRKIQKSQIDIRLLVDNNQKFEMGGIPNSVFMRELKSYGIKMRSRITHSVVAKFPNGDTKVFNQENHRKIISIDGQQLMTGSSNINPDSLQGTSREFGIQIFNKDQIKKFEAEFISTWESPNKVMKLDIENYQAIIAGQKMSKSFSRLINGISSMLLRAKDDLESKR